MALSFLVPHRTVLLVADEALYIYACGPRGPRQMEVIPWDSENFEKNAASVIAKDCGGKPVLILCDLVEQHYRKERMLRSGVNFFDRASIVRRKLQIAFPNYPARAAYVLKEKSVQPATKSSSYKDKNSKASAGGVADIYIFSAVPDSRQMALTMGAVNQSLVQLGGFVMLPVESSDMVKALSTKLLKQNQQKSEWIVFMGQHKHGGLRQIVIKNGELALTRMTPVPDSDNDAQGWANDVYQEFNATMSYLTRFSFQQEDGLHIIAMANQQAGDALRSLIDDNYGYTSMTAPEVAATLGMPLDTLDDRRYADPLHVGWVGRKTKFIMPMRSPAIEGIAKPRRFARAAIFLLCCTTIFFGYQFFFKSQTLGTVSTDLESSQLQITQLNLQHQKEIARKEKLGFDVTLIQSTMGVYDDLVANAIKPLPLYDSIGKALGREMRIDKINVGKPQPVVPLPGIVTTQKPSVYESHLQITYPSTSDVAKGNAEVEGLKNRLQTLLKNSKVEVSKKLKDYKYVEEIVVETGDLDRSNVGQDYIAEITIKGPPVP